MVTLVRPSALACLLKLLEADFGQPVCGPALRRSIIVLPAVVLIYQGPLLALFLVWGLATLILPLMYRQLLEWRLQHHKAVVRTEAAEASLGFAEEQSSQLGRELENVTRALRKVEDELQEVTERLRDAE